jgi:hypothetical protein
MAVGVSATIDVGITTVVPGGRAGGGVAVDKDGLGISTYDHMYSCVGAGGGGIK